MIKGLKMVCGEIHFPTLFICGGCLFSTFYPCTELAGMIRVKCAVAGMFILLLSRIKAIISKKPLVAHPEKILKTFLLLGVAEIFIAILQSIRVLLSYNSYFRFTGSFDNPAILAMMMAVCLPISLFCTIRAIGEKQKIWFLLTLCMVACLMLAESRACIIAEVMFFAKGEKEKLQGTVIGTEGSWGNNPNRTKETVFDGDVLTSFDAPEGRGCWTGLDMGKPVKVDHIIYYGRGDGNGIEIGDEYELLYWNNGWKSMGRQKAKNVYVKYKNVPQNALYHLRNHTKGTDERIFTFENEKQVWW